MLHIVEQDLQLSFRPHMKTHKTIEGALLQTGGRRSKIVVSTLAELQFYDRAGFTDIVYAVPFAGLSKIDVLWTQFVAPQKDVTLVMDNVQQLQQLETYLMRKQLNKRTTATAKWKMLLLLGVEPEPRSSSHVSAPTMNQPPPLMHQVGLDPTADTSFHLATILERAPYVDFQGVYLHAAHSYDATSKEACTQAARDECTRIGTFVQRLRDEYQIRCTHVSVGSTPTCTNPAIYKESGNNNNGTKKELDLDLIHDVYTKNGITELHAGNYFVNDQMQWREIHSCTQQDLALFVKTQVISSSHDALDTPTPTTLLIDCGWTGLSTQKQQAETTKKENTANDTATTETTGVGYGVIVSHPELQLVSLKQETGEVHVVAPASPPQQQQQQQQPHYPRYPVGTTELTLVPYHACAAAQQYPCLYIENSHGECIDVWTRCPSK